MADRIEKLQRRHNSNTTHPEAKLIKTIRTKLQQNNAMIAHADKGNSIVILPTQQYETKIQNFLRSNNFHTATTDPTKNFQAQIRKTIKESKTNPKRHQMEVHQHEPFCPLHQRTDKTTQTGPTDPARSKLARRPSLQTVQIVHKKN